MLKEFLWVGMGSFLGGGMRFLVSKAIQSVAEGPFPLGTFSINVMGCMLIGFLSGTPVATSWLSPSAKLILTTGFCGGFTTFSTFMYENSVLMKEGHEGYMVSYILGSLAVGFVAVLVGLWLGKQM